MRKTLYVLYFASAGKDNWTLWGDDADREDFLTKWTGKDQLEDIEKYLRHGQKWMIDKLEWEE